MTVDNRKSIIKWKLIRFVMSVVVLIFGLLIGFDYIKPPSEEVDKQTLLIILIAPYVFYYILFFIRDVHYINVEMKPSLISVKYSSLLPGSMNRAIEIKADTFVKAEFKRSFFGIRHHVIFYQRVKQGEAKYPPISLSGLNYNEVDQLIKNLGNYS